MKKVTNTLKAGALALMLFMVMGNTVTAQEKLTQDTLECHIIGFSVSPMMADNLFSFSKTADGENRSANTMYGLYENPYLDFGVHTIYKYKSNWMVTLEGDMWIGNNNLRDRVNRMPGVFATSGIVIGVNGVDGQYSCNNRGLSAKVGLGKIFVVDKNNPNSGILAKISGGWTMSKTVFSQDYTEAPCYQLAGDYLKLYDHRRGGLMITEGIGYWFMSNRLNLVNCYAAFEVSQCWSVSTRDYQIDHIVGLQGPDNDRHFDMIYTLKLCWMFPLKGKTVYDYYYY